MLDGVNIARETEILGLLLGWIMQAAVLSRTQSSESADNIWASVRPRWKRDRGPSAATVHTAGCDHGIGNSAAEG